MVNLKSFWKPATCGQTVLPDRSFSITQKLAKNAKIKQFKCDILGDFQTLCLWLNLANAEIRSHDESMRNQNSSTIH